MKRVLFIILILFSLSLYSQVTKETAKKHFDNMEYANAAVELEQLIKKQGESQELLQMLSDAYYNNAKFLEAEPWLNKLLVNYESTVDSRYYFRYANVLKAVKKPQDADRWIQKFIKANPNDSRSVSYKNQQKALDEILKKRDPFEIENSSLNTSYSDFGAMFYKDQLVFTAAKNGGAKDLYKRTNQPFLDLYKTELDEKGQPRKGIHVLSKELNTQNHDGVTTFSKDGTIMYFTRTNNLKEKLLKNETIINKLKIFKAELVNDNWSKIEPVPFNNDNYSVGHPALNDEGTKLYFISDMPGGYGMTDLYVVDINPDGTYGAPVNMGSSINSEGKEMFPFVKGNTLYFSSNGHWGMGALDVFKVDLNDPSLTPVNMGKPVNSAFDDFAFVFDDERKLGFVSSNRPGGKGDDDIYLLKTKTYDQYVFGTVIEAVSEKLMPESTVILYDEEGKELNKTRVGMDAGFKFKTEANQSYKITGTKKDYTTDIKDFYATEGKDKEVTLVIKKQEFVFVRGKCIVKIDPIYFDFDKYNIRPDAAIELDKVVEIMKKYPELIIEGGSHTDSRGRFAYNERLSANRAQSTVDYIINKGIDSKRITAKGYGETILVNGCADGVQCSEEEHQLNRRTEFTIVNLDAIQAKYPDICGSEEMSINEMITKRKFIVEKRKGEALENNFEQKDVATFIKTKPIDFSLNSAELTKAVMIELDKVIELMYIYSSLQVEVGVHTDSRGDDQDNLRISDQRARAIQDYIKARGVSTYRISAKGYGETRLLNQCVNGVECTEAEHLKNRRVEFRVFNPEVIK